MFSVHIFTVACSTAGEFRSERLASRSSTSGGLGPGWAHSGGSQFVRLIEFVTAWTVVYPVHVRIQSEGCRSAGLCVSRMVHSRGSESHGTPNDQRRNGDGTH